MCCRAKFRTKVFFNYNLSTKRLVLMKRANFGTSFSESFFDNKNSKFYGEQDYKHFSKENTSVLKNK